jgi:hypothetical protein
VAELICVGSGRCDILVGIMKRLSIFLLIVFFAASVTAQNLTDLAGVYTGTWRSKSYDVDGALVLTIAVEHDKPKVAAVFTGSEYLNEDELIAVFTHVSAGIWKMEYKGRKSKIKGTGIFKDDSFIGDYKFTKLFWKDLGDWRLRKE